MSELPPLPAISQAPITIILLLRDAPPDVEDLIARWTAELERLHRDGEMVIVDDANLSEESRAQLTQRFPQVTVLHHPKREGIGASLRTGLRAARHPLVFYTTCDRAYQPGDLKLLLAEIDKAHLVSGFRRWQKAPRGLRLLGSIWRGVLRLVFSIGPERLPGWLGWREHWRAIKLRLIFGVRLRDPASMFCLLRRSILTRIPIQSNGAFAHVEVIAKANFLGCMMMEVPVNYRPQEKTERFSSREARQVFSHPDFGPPVLPPEVEWSPP